jgi:hypothetical protein
MQMENVSEMKVLEWVEFIETRHKDYDEQG